MNLEERRQNWLDTAIELAIELDAIKDMIDESVRPYGDAAPEEIRRKLPELRQIMAEKASALAELERGAEPALGIAALLPREPQPVVRRALTMMILANITDRFGGRRGDVGDLIALTTAGDMDEAMTLRGAFRNDTGSLRPLVQFECLSRSGNGLIAASTALKENAFNLAMGLPNDAEFENVVLSGADDALSPKPNSRHC